ncbi:MAG: hypothetical protein SAK29_11825 [Scytonema sp. PMC 1069.18]|nr:hypothetical protein [Scytonema sp. PMC 1069.18]MEC4882894.1 hypothetical protein [Scytonema sp. PMC 1070.18]
MKSKNKPSPQEELNQRIEKVASFKERLEQEIQAIMTSLTPAPPGCWIARYQAKGRQEFYWYYKLQATEPIFPTLTEGKLSKYKHLGKAGSQKYMSALEQIIARSKIDALDRSVETLNQGLKDLIEETSKHNK